MNKIMNVKKGSIKKGLVLGALLLLASCAPVESPFGGERANVFAARGPARRISYLSEAEQAMITEANFARTEPKKYVREVLQPFMKRCGNSSSDYCVTYVKTAIEYMNAMDPVEPLQPSLGLTLATRDFIADPKRDTHSSTSFGFGSFPVRAGYYGDSGIGGEIAWPTTVAGGDQETVVSGWIIDNGNSPGFGHRKILLGKKYRYIGIGFGYGASNAEKAGYKNKPAAYATLASGIYTDKEQVAGQPLSETSIATEVTLPKVISPDDGSIKVTLPDGSIANEVTLPDGSIANKVTLPGGSNVTVVILPDGSIANEVTLLDDSKVTLPDGSEVTLPDGRITNKVTLPDGSVVTLPDGSVVKKSGDSIVANVVTWPVLRFTGGKYKLYNAVDPANNGKTVAAPQGGELESGWDSP